MGKVDGDASREVFVAKECPRCGSQHVAPVIYTVQDVKFAVTSSVREAAFDADPDAPNWECQDCRHRWPDPGRLQVARELIQFYRRAKADLATG